MTEESFSSRKEILGELLAGTNIYIVPPNQRDYSWGKEHFEDLWTDLIGAIQEDNYFFGSMILQNTPDPKKKIILDGQQRLATATVLFAVIRDGFNILKDPDNAKDIQKHYILDKIFKKEVRKLTLNLINKDFFYYCIQKDPNDKDAQNFKDYEKKNKLSKANKSLRNAYYFFKDKIEDEFKNKSGEERISFLTRLCTTLTDKFIIIKIQVGSEEEAYMIFETINERGLELSVADLFKNYLVRKAPEKDKDDVVRIWKDLLISLDDKIRPFLRHYWLSKIQLTTERQLFSKLKQYIETGKNSAKNFVKDLKEEATVYSELLNPDVQYWEDKQVFDLLKDFNVLNIKQCLPVLMSGRDKFNNKNFKKLLKLITNFSFRYSTICNLHNNILERKYSDISEKIRNSKIKTTDEVKDLLLDIYPDDNQFYDSFKMKELDNSSIARYILKKIDLACGSYKDTEKIDYETLSLEHILPKSPQDDWIKYFKEQGIKKKDLKQLIHRIGNKTLLDVNMNTEAANSYFAEKSDKYYKRSRLKINENLKTITQWNRKAIEDRQAELGKVAKTIWKI